MLPVQQILHLKSYSRHNCRIPSFASITRTLRKPVDASSLAAFRVGFGLIMLWEAERYLTRGWQHRYFTEPDMLFSYLGFSWVQPWPGEGMTIHFIALGFLGLLIALGLFYRLSTVLFFLGFSYMFLLSQARYLNHFYLVILLSFLMCVVPAHKHYSLDALLWRRRSTGKGSGASAADAATTVPAWSVWALRMQMGIPYFFGGIAKLNADWLRASPIGYWIADETSLPFVGPFMGEVWMGYLFAYGGLLVDLFVIPLMLFRRTRMLGYSLVLFFNLMNAAVFSIGIFPWVMIAGSLIFFETDWPKRVWDTWSLSPEDRVRAQYDRDRAVEEAAAEELTKPETLRQRLLLSFLGLYTALQFLLPLRHFLYLGNVHWTEEGHRFAWHMKLRSKRGTILFRVRDRQTREEWVIDPDDELTDRQVEKMSGRPEMILMYAHHLRDRFKEERGRDVAVFADSWGSLNRRPEQLFVDPTVDLAQEEHCIFCHKSWIIPLYEGVPGR